jgi:hypothetical protein
MKLMRIRNPAYNILLLRYPGAGRVRQGHGKDCDGRRGQERHRLQQGPGAGRGRPQGTQQEGAYVGRVYVGHKKRDCNLIHINPY